MKKLLFGLLFPLLIQAQNILDKAAYSFCDCLDRAKITNSMTNSQIDFKIEECKMKALCVHYQEIKDTYKIRYSKDSINTILLQIYEKGKNCESHKVAQNIIKTNNLKNAENPVTVDTSAVVSFPFTTIKITNYEAYGYFYVIGTDTETNKSERFLIFAQNDDSIGKFMKERIQYVGKTATLYWEEQPVFNSKKNIFEIVKVVKSIDL